MLSDAFIDDLLRLQTRHAGLIWRMGEAEGVNIEFFLEELAIDCSSSMQKAGIAAEYKAGAARVVHIPIQEIQKSSQVVLDELGEFLDTCNHFSEASPEK